MTLDDFVEKIDLQNLEKDMMFSDEEYCEDSNADKQSVQNQIQPENKKTNHNE